jgi:hypothetical protein
MDVHRLGFKFFAADRGSVRLDDFIPIFHRWIQQQNLSGHLLIDVHDYSHIHQGPGILLVGYEGNFSVDLSAGRPGLIYYRKTPTPLAPAEHLAAICKSTLEACRLLEKDARLRFNRDEFLVLANDRLHAPNNDETLDELKPALTAALRQIFDSAQFQFERTSLDPRDRFTVTCKRQS